MDNSAYNKIDDYLEGRLEGKELEAFEQQLNIDMNLAKTVSEQKQAMELLQKAVDIEMKKEALEVQEKFLSVKKPKSLFRTLRPWIAAAAIVLLLIVSFWSLRSTSSEKLFDDYYIAYNTSFGDRDVASELEIKLAEASKLYRQKNYANALPIFEAAQLEIKDAKLQLMTGISQLELGEYAAAIQSFEQIIKEQDPVFQYHGIWYTAMTYLKAGDQENAKTMLERLVQASDVNGVFKQAEATEILKKL